MMRASCAKCLSDLHDLLLRHGEIAAQGMGSISTPMRWNSYERGRFCWCGMKLTRRFLAEENIFARSQAGHEVELLVNNADAGGLRRLRGVNARGRTVDGQFALVMCVGAAENLDERTFAGTILAKQCEHFACVQREVYLAERLHTGKGLADAAHPKQRRLGGIIGHRLFQLRILVRLSLGVKRGRNERLGLKLFAGLILHDELHNLAAHFVRMLNGIGIDFAILNRLLAFQLTVETR